MESLIWESEYFLLLGKSEIQASDLQKQCFWKDLSHCNTNFYLYLVCKSLLDILNMLQMWSVHMLRQPKAPQMGIVAQGSPIQETAFWWCSSNSQLSEIRDGLNDSLDCILCNYTAVKISINHVLILWKPLKILGERMKNSSYPGQLNLCNKQRTFHSNSWVLFWQPVCFCGIQLRCRHLVSSPLQV